MLTIRDSARATAVAAFAQCAIGLCMRRQRRTVLRECTSFVFVFYFCQKSENKIINAICFFFVFFVSSDD